MNGAFKDTGARSRRDSHQKFFSHGCLAWTDCSRGLSSRRCDRELPGRSVCGGKLRQRPRFTVGPNNGSCSRIRLSLHPGISEGPKYGDTRQNRCLVLFAKPKGRARLGRYELRRARGYSGVQFLTDSDAARRVCLAENVGTRSFLIERRGALTGGIMLSRNDGGNAGKEHHRASTESALLARGHRVGCAR